MRDLFSTALGFLILCSLAWIVFHRQVTVDNLHRQNTNSKKHGVKLDSEIDETQYAVSHKRQIMVQLFADEITLDAALDQFQLVNRNTLALRTWQRLHPTGTEPEFAAHNLSAFLVSATQTPNLDQVFLANRLMADLQLQFPNLRTICC